MCATIGLRRVTYRLRWQRKSGMNVFADTFVLPTLLASQVVSQLPDTRLIICRFVECLIVLTVYLCVARDRQ